MSSKDPGQARNGRRFRIDAWPLTPIPANIPLYVQLRLARIASKLVRRTPRRGHNEDLHKASDGNERVRATESNLPPPPSGGGSEHERPGGCSDAERTWSHSYAELAFSTLTNTRVAQAREQAWCGSCAEEGSAAALGHTSASEYSLSCKPHELGETKR